MTENNIFADETLAVDAISDEIGLLERKFERGCQLDRADLQVLMQCSLRLTRLVSNLSFVNAPDASTRSRTSKHCDRGAAPPPDTIAPPAVRAAS
jgi:hypothetical protein